MTPVRLALIQPRTFPWSKGSKAFIPPAPHAPLHRCILIHVGRFQTFLCQLVVGAKLLVLLVLLGATGIRQVVSRIRENVASLPLFLDHGYLAWRKLLELLLLRWRLRCDRFKAGGRQHALSVLRAGLCAGAVD